MLKICGLSVSEKQYLSNCAIEQLKYLQESHWVTFGDKEKSLFEATTVKDADEDIMLKVRNIKLCFFLEYQKGEYFLTSLLHSASLAYNVKRRKRQR